MSFDPLAALAVGFAGGVLTLDKVAVLQSLVSRPLPTALITGALLGEPTLGLMAGVYMELIWLSRQPVGGVVVPDEMLAALSAVAAASALPPSWSQGARAAAGVLFALPYGLIGRRLDLLARKWNSPLLERAREGLKAGDERAVGKAQARGAANFFIAGLTGSLLAAFTAGPGAGWVVSHAGPNLRGAMEVMAVLLPIIGAGALLGSMNGRKPKMLFAAGLLAAFLAAKAGLGGTFSLFKAAKAPR